MVQRTDHADLSQCRRIHGGCFHVRTDPLKLQQDLAVRRFVMSSPFHKAQFDLAVDDIVPP